MNSVRGLLGGACRTTVAKNSVRGIMSWLFFHFFNILKYNIALHRLRIDDDDLIIIM